MHCWHIFPHALNAGLLNLAAGELAKQTVLDTLGHCGLVHHTTSALRWWVCHRAFLHWVHPGSLSYFPAAASSAAPYFRYGEVVWIDPSPLSSFRFLSLGVRIAILCLACLYILEAHDLHAVTGSQLERNLASWWILPPVSLNLI